MAVDSATVEELVRSCGSLVYGFCRQLTPTRADADDVYQQAFLRIMDMPGTLDWEGNPAGFLMAVAARVWRDEVRKRSRRERIAPTVDVDAAGPLPDGCEAVAPCRVEDGLEQDQTRRDVRRAVGRLPDKMRAPVLLFYVGGLAVEDVAHALGVPVGTVKSRLNRARRLLRSELEAMGYGA